MNHKRLAAWLWLSQIQYFIIQWLVALDWTQPFSLRFNTISDLGNTVCGPYDGRFVCSPLYPLMNASFVALGVTMALGALLLLCKATQLRLRVGYVLLALGGLGTILVGLFPENAPGMWHATGAALPFLFGNIGLLLLATEADLPTWLRHVTRGFAILALIGLVGFVSHVTPILGNGGVERFVAYPQTVWMIVVGGLVLARRR